MLKKLLCAALCALLLPTATTHAAPTIIEADGVYTMGDNDTPKSARDAARNEAMRAATERAGVYIESTSDVQDSALTKDEIRTVAAAVLRVTEEEITPTLIGDVWRYHVHLVCSVDTEGIDLKALAGSKAELDRLRQERDALRSENAAMQSRAEQRTQQQTVLYVYGDAARDQKTQQPSAVQVYGEAAQYSARSASDNRTIAVFADTEEMILRGETEHAVADLSLLLGDPSVTGDARAYAYLLRGCAYYAQHMNRLALTDFAAAEDTPHTNAVYPIWRLHEYRGRIAYAEQRYDEAADEVAAAWNASDKTDEDLRSLVRRYERRAAQEQRHRMRGDGGGRSTEIVIIP